MLVYEVGKIPHMKWGNWKVLEEISLLKKLWMHCVIHCCHFLSFLPMVPKQNKLWNLAN